MENGIEIRELRTKDLARVGEMAGDLVRFHHDLDARRFLLVEGVERGYARYFESQLAERGTIILVAHRGEELLGYAYARLESRDWNALLDAHGALHDIFVAPGERRRGIAAALLGEVVTRLGALGAPRIVLMTAVQNQAAQGLFARYGFRSTMLEMTRESDG